MRGDLFDQEDANLVVGFTDTFDTATERDPVISRESVQGQLVERLFGGERKLLDDRLQAGLKAFTPAAHGTDPGQAPRPARPLPPRHHRPPCRWTAAGSSPWPTPRLGNDLVARSAPAELRASLNALWPAVARYGMYKPVAIPLIGSGLARVVELDRTQLLLMIVESFTAHCRREPTTAPELRIVIRPADLERTDLSALGTFLRTSRHGGTGVSTASGDGGAQGRW
ncbi:DUF6430 domain-containing protein [Streptomyces thinghirensis]|nr:DUF6430 domain-containing protein [Streptomyces thinghirensis]